MSYVFGFRELFKNWPAMDGTVSSQGVTLASFLVVSEVQLLRLGKEIQILRFLLKAIERNWDLAPADQ
jgi:hypothetical protein